MDPDYSKSTHHIAYGAHSMEGEHHTNEDRYKVKSNLFQDSAGNGVFYAGLFDGHGGALCAEYCKRNMHRNVIRELKKVGDLTDGSLRDEMMVAVLLNAFSRTEDDFLRLSVELKEFSGACANVVLIYRDTIYVANLGDCRSVLGRTKGRSIGLSRDHKASVEKSRIRKVGGFVKNGRVNGVLAISRTIGDREFKDPVVTGNHHGGSSSPLSSSSSDVGSQRSRSPSTSRAKAAHGSPKSPGGAFVPPPVTRRVSSPNTILLKNVRETVDSPARTRVRPAPSNGGTPLSRSSSTVDDAPHSNSREPSPLPFSVQQAAGNNGVSPAKEGKRGSVKTKRNSSDRKGGKSPDKGGIKVSSSAGAIPSSPLSVTSSSSNPAASDSDSASSGSPSRPASALNGDAVQASHARSKSGEESDSATSTTTTTTTTTSPTATAANTTTTTTTSTTATTTTTAAASATAGATSKASSKKHSNSTSTTSTTVASADKESASDLSESPDPPSMSHSDSEEGESSEFVEGMFDVIECYDAESKQKKFGFKKRRPPKDPKYDTATIVSAIPEITIMRRSNDDDWIFLASDGFYDLFTSKQAGLTVTKHLLRNGRDRLSETSKALCGEAALLGSEDDITGILIMVGAPKGSATTAATANPTISESPETEDDS